MVGEASELTSNLVVTPIPPRIKCISESIRGVRSICSPQHMDQLRSLCLSQDGDDEIWILTLPNPNDRICSQGPRNEDVGQPANENILDSNYYNSSNESCNSSSNGDDSEDLIYIQLRTKVRCLR